MGDDMKAYSVMLFIFIFGFVSGAIQESGLFVPNVPQQKSAFNQAEITELGKGAADQGLNPLFMYGIIAMFAKVLFSGMLALLTIIPMLLAWGIPVWIGMMFQAPLWLMEASGFYQMLTGYNFLGMD